MEKYTMRTTSSHYLSGYPSEMSKTGRKGEVCEKRHVSLVCLVYLVCLAESD